MPINYKDINELTEETNIAGTEKVPVSSTKYVLFNKIKDWIINSLKTAGLDLGGKQIKNVAIEVVTSLPATNNFDGRRVTYQGRSYIWDGSSWKCDSDFLEIGGRNLVSGIMPEQEYAVSGTYTVYPLTDPYRVRGKKVIMRFKGKSSNGTNSIYISISSGASSKNRIVQSMPLPLDYEDFEFTANVEDDNSIDSIVIVYGKNWHPHNLEGTVSIKDLKLEQGTIATDWTPAPEDKADDSQSINYDLSAEPAETGTKNKTANTLWQNLFNHTNFLWLKLKDLFPLTQATTHNYLPKIDNLNKKLVNSGFYEENGLLFGNIPLGPNLINNSWMNRVASDGSPEGFIPATPMSGASLITQAVSPLTKGFEGVHLPSFDSSYMVSDAELATETNPMWYSAYYTGLRTTLGGLRNGWGSFGGGNIMKVLGSNFTKGSDYSYMGSFVTMKTDANQMGTHWIFSCWVKLVKGKRFGVGSDAGYYAIGPYPNGVSKTITDASPQGWYLHKVVVTTNQISNISAQIMALAFEPDNNGEIEAYIALPYLAISNTKGDGNHSWTNSVLDRLWDKGIKVDLTNKNVSFDNSVTSNETINFDTNNIEPSQAGTVTKTSTWLWQYLTQSVNWLRTTLANHNHDTAYLGITEKAADSDLLDGKHASDFAQLENDKIKASNLPDYLLGQVLYGGSIDSYQVCTFSSLYKDKFNTTANTGALGNPLLHVGVYFIASSNFTLSGTIDVKTGDWVISNGIAWGKIDNTDAVASVNGKKGVVNLSYDDIGDIPMASEERIGGIMLGYVDGLDANFLEGKHASEFATSEQGDKADSSLQPTMINDLSNIYLPKWDDTNNKFINSLISDDGSTPKYGANKIWHSGNIAGDDIKDVLGLVGYNNYNKQDIFISGLPTYSNNFNGILNIGSYKVSGGYSNAPNQNCGTNTISTTSIKGTLNVFRSGTNDSETIQQLFWVLSGKTEQYQRSYDGTTWTIWKRLIKCDDYATLDRGGIISEANFGELFRAPDLIQLWNTDDLPLSGDVYHLDTLSVATTIENSIELDGGINIIGLTSERRYRVTYEVHCKKLDGKGDVTIRIEDGGGELYSTTEYISEYDIRKTITFSVILTNMDLITPSIEVSDGLSILIHPHYYQISVEEIKFPIFTPNPA